MSSRPSKTYLSAAVAAAVAVVMMVPTLGNATPPAVWKGAPKPPPGSAPRSEVPEDRYAMAGGCYAIGTARGYVVRDGDGFAATGSAASAEPFHFQATDLGSYLLYGTRSDFVAANEGTAGKAAYGVTRSEPGAIVGGATLETTDAAAEAVVHSPANADRATEIIAADRASRLADWTITESGAGFAIDLPEADRSLAVNDTGRLVPAPRGQGSIFSFELTEGCARFPEIEVNVDGPILGGATGFQEVRGYFDAHLHMMAFEFLGGRARCGRPWHRYGVEHALVDCPDHTAGGYGAALEKVVSGQGPADGHDPGGWPTFKGWPRHNSLTHEQVYYKWLERAWRGGLRMFTNLLVDNNQLCKLYPFKRTYGEDRTRTCNEMEGVRLQHKRIYQLQDYIDAQSGGPGEGWFRIVTDPFEARRVINDGKLAVVLGIEVSVPLDCGLILTVPQCDVEKIEQGLDEVRSMGVTQMELVNKFDNAFSGVAGDGGTTGVVVNHGNKLETGSYWRMDTCEEHSESEHVHAHDRTQINLHDEWDKQDGGGTPPFTGRDALAGAILAAAGTSGAAPVYPEGPHCNQLGLSQLGKLMIRGMVERGMIFDPDHMSALAQKEALDYLSQNDPRSDDDPQDLPGDPGVLSSHGWSNDTIYPRVYELGGVVTPYANGARSFVDAWAEHRQWADPRYVFGFGYGADTNGFGSQAGPRGADAPNAVSYPFTGFGGVTVHKQVSGQRTYDINVDGVAHYGLYTDWVEDLRRVGGEAIVEDMLRGPEAYLQMWERAVGIAPDACRPDVPDLTDADLARLSRGMTPEDVLRTLGQPNARVGDTFTYCLAGSRSSTLRFDKDGRLLTWNSHR